MHQALLIPELLPEIFKFLHVSLSEKTTFGPHSIWYAVPISRKSLAALARTCKAFHEPAMDLLWSEIEVLESLLGCVPRLHPLIYCDGRMRWDWVRDSRPLSADEAHQFLRHSARVRSLTIMSDVDHRSRLHFFSVTPTELYNFPRLRSLTVYTDYLNIFPPHTLHHCYPVTPDIQSILICFANLEHFCVKIPYDMVDSTADLLSRISDTVRLCKQLATLSCPLIDWAAWRHLSNLSTLKRVDIVDMSSDAVLPWPLEWNITSFSPFSNVTILSFELHSAAYVIPILQHSQFPSLKKFNIHVEVLSLPETVQLFHVLSKCKACKTIEKISISSRYRRDHNPSDDSLSVMPHLRCFMRLRSLHLSCFDFYLNLDNDFLLKIMSTWPHMRCLEVEDCRFDHSPVTFQGVFAALRLCPQLHKLRIAIDNTTIDLDPDFEPMQNPSLRMLDLRISVMPKIANAEALACTIFSCFPHLKRVGFISGHWNEVNGHLDSLRGVPWCVKRAASNN
ncbi:hypothetical protein BDR04DRAFT_65656 [Suillus decipiens]|nr:hypothetical protein BDR04DRAFT_65656 [Suillus decipiens]